MTSLFNHIQGKNGSEWVNFKKQYGEDNILILAIDAAKYTHKAMICNFYGEILVEAFDFDAHLGLSSHRSLRVFPSLGDVLMYFYCFYYCYLKVVVWSGRPLTPAGIANGFRWDEL